MSTTESGKRAEKMAARYLAQKGYKVIEQNFRNRFCEIDIIAIKDRQIIFIEVKYRRSDAFGNPLEAITKNKFDRVKRAIDFFIKEYPDYIDYQPKIDVISISGDFGSAKINHLENCFL